MGTPTQYLWIYWIGWVRLPSICEMFGSDGYAYPVLSLLERIGQTYELTNIIVDVFEYHFQVCQKQRMYTSVFVDPESSTQADGAQSSRVPLPLLQDPYEAIRQAYLVGTDTESSYDSSSSSTLPIKKRYRGTSELILGTDSEKDEESEDVEEEGPSAEDKDPAVKDEGLAVRVEGLGIDDESYGLDGKSHCVDDESHGLDDESHGLDDESYGIDGEGHGIKSDGLGLREEEAVPEGQEQAVLVVGTTVSEPLGLEYGVLRRQELVLEEDHVYHTFEVGQGSGSAPDPRRSKMVSAFRQPTLTTWTNPEDGIVYIDVLVYPSPAPPIQTSPSPEWTSTSPMATLTATIPVDEDQFIERYRFRSLEHKQERTAVMFRALWRRMLALEAWVRRVDTQMTDMSQAGYDDHRLVHDMLLQQTALQQELQETRDHVTVLEQERDRRER
nr:hypothetical protein [Tanacetum cinerariifolium]